MMVSYDDGIDWEKEGAVDAAKEHMSKLKDRIEELEALLLPNKEDWPSFLKQALQAFKNVTTLRALVEEVLPDEDDELVWSEEAGWHCECCDLHVIEDDPNPPGHREDCWIVKARIVLKETSQ